MGIDKIWNNSYVRIKQNLYKHNQGYCPRQYIHYEHLTQFKFSKGEKKKSYVSWCRKSKRIGRILCFKKLYKRTQSEGEEKARF